MVQRMVQAAAVNGRSADFGHRLHELALVLQKGAVLGKRECQRSQDPVTDQEGQAGRTLKALTVHLLNVGIACFECLGAQEHGLALTHRVGHRRVELKGKARPAAQRRRVVADLTDQFEFRLLLGEQAHAAGRRAQHALGRLQHHVHHFRQLVGLTHGAGDVGQGLLLLQVRALLDLELQVQRPDLRVVQVAPGVTAEPDPIPAGKLEPERRQRAALIRPQAAQLAQQRRPVTLMNQVIQSRCGKNLTAPGLRSSPPPD